jgi:hypothetical protein
MPDIFKTFIKHMDGVNKAAVADAAAKAMAEHCDARIETLRAAMQQACDLLAERKHGNRARSPGHNARLVLEAALKEKQLGR